MSSDTFPHPKRNENKEPIRGIIIEENIEKGKVISRKETSDSEQKRKTKRDFSQRSLVAACINFEMIQEFTKHHKTLTIKLRN